SRSRPAKTTRSLSPDRYFLVNPTARNSDSGPPSGSKVQPLLLRYHDADRDASAGNRPDKLSGGV
ncbi:MAG: hypothetical protein NT090_16860, partial [Acidobacteria bacterium]|nr:hypothetical protein [Acidobacteriota bacterium]